MILRFMGDMAEPVMHEGQEEEEEGGGVSLRKRIYNTLSRKTSKSKLEKEANFKYDPDNYEGESEVSYCCFVVIVVYCYYYCLVVVIIVVVIIVIIVIVISCVYRLMRRDGRV